MKSSLSLFPVVVLTVWLTACKKNNAETIPKALVTPAQFAKAQQIVNAIDYLPFNYTKTGCYARALYMSMELAAEKIPSSAALVVAYRKENMLQFDGNTWAWHVAPMLVPVQQIEKNVSFKDTKDEAIYILDPAVQKGAALTLTAWISEIQGTKARIFMLPGSREVWNAYNRSKDRRIVLSSFDEFPAFFETDVSDACRWMKTLLVESNAPQLVPKLEERTRYLVKRLKTVNKYNADGFDCDTAKLIRKNRDAQDPVKEPICQSYRGEDIEVFAREAVCFEGNKTADERKACVEDCVAAYRSVHR